MDPEQRAALDESRQQIVASAAWTGPQVRDPLIARRTLTLLLAMFCWWSPEASVAQDARQADKAPDIALWRAAGIVRLARPVDPPPLILSDLSGHPVDVRQLRGQVVLIYFWATW